MNIIYIYHGGSIRKFGVQSGTELYHHGVLGMKWGVRRYQNKDGSLTTAGKAKTLKIQKQERDLKDLTGYGLDPESGAYKKNWKRNEDRYVKLFNDVIEKSVDWYNHAPVSTRQKATYHKMDHDPNLERSNRHKYDEEILGNVLLDLGYENTPNSRKYIRNVVMWD